MPTVKSRYIEAEKCGYKPEQNPYAPEKLAASDQPMVSLEFEKVVVMRLDPITGEFQQNVPAESEWGDGDGSIEPLFYSFAEIPKNGIISGQDGELHVDTEKSCFTCPDREPLVPRVGQVWQTEWYNVCAVAPMSCVKATFCAPCLICSHRQTLIDGGKYHCCQNSCYCFSCRLCGCCDNCAEDYCPSFAMCLESFMCCNGANIKNHDMLQEKYNLEGSCCDQQIACMHNTGLYCLCPCDTYNYCSACCGMDSECQFCIGCCVSSIVCCTSSCEASILICTLAQATS